MTTVTIKNPIDEFSKRLQKIDKKLAKEIKNYLPEWWENELINSPGAVQQALVSIAKFTNLNLKNVLNTGELLHFKEENICCYKHANNKEYSELAAATAIVQSLSNTVADITIQNHLQFQDAHTIRDNLLQSNKPWIDLKSLVNYCWKNGVPVLYLPELPVSKKMDGVVVDVNGRSVISLTKKHKHESNLLFLLAHEMGHIFHNHLKLGQTIIDKRINRQENGLDEQEKQANNFAIELLTGAEDTKFHSYGKKLKAKALASGAEEKGIKHNIDPGHVILNWGYTTNHWKIANAALNIFYPEPDWKVYIRNKLCEEINEDEANEDQLDYLYKLMKVGE
ncbi:MAG: ImmA/IrrE family metallo-endopeptidase [Candidatus Marithrix sp.]